MPSEGASWELDVPAALSVLFAPAAARSGGAGGDNRSVNVLLLPGPTALANSSASVAAASRPALESVQVRHSSIPCALLQMQPVTGISVWSISLLVLALAIFAMAGAIIAAWRLEPADGQDDAGAAKGLCRRRQPRHSQEGLRRPSSWSLSRGAMSAAQSTVRSRCSWGSSSECLLPTERDRSQAPGWQRLVPLCPLLVVPEGTRLNCMVQNDVCRRRQEMAFNIRGVAGAHLFQVRVAELGTDTPGVYVETLGGETQLAVLSTEGLWLNASSLDRLSISRPNGSLFGNVQKLITSGEYIIDQDGMELLRFSGDFQNHNITVTSPRSAGTVATVSQDTPEEYQVVVQTRNDAGLVILGLLAIDKCEISASGPSF